MVTTFQPDIWKPDSERRAGVADRRAECRMLVPCSGPAHALHCVFGGLPVTAANAEARNVSRRHMSGLGGALWLYGSLNSCIDICGGFQTTRAAAHRPSRIEGEFGSVREETGFLLVTV